MVCSEEVQIQTSSLDLDELNQRFDTAHPREILAWCIRNIPTGLVQTSAFGVSGMVTMDILYRELKPEPPVPVLFLDTLHHFRETLELVENSKNLYNLDLRVYKIEGVDSREAFAEEYGEALWEKDVQKFHYITKVEPLQRGLTELNTVAWLTGRRRDQASTRAVMPVFERDIKHRIKVNPLANWTRNQTWAYVMENNVPYNVLHDRGYGSIGDEPLTTPIAKGEDERAGRWRGTAKTECGIHI
ncbi:phosphoadenosine phosphosulfate reductase [Microcoleus sp. FACHB-68]|uniref:phosphoadenosine phosphosulfate reductase n=1 Tax=Microcoleus sp. FACHB-68 TaxID=2692826 RepID=UPI0016859A57|nr:phosphoadenosine phosphosulfate reductase [Microcoleus sp. FACHB-68]MBD1938912.1 phosphoadenosine phosphosulfate reductase [Microcoleus sp. FACHB-68]